MKEKFVTLYSNIAKEVSKLSYAKRLQVGAIIVKDDRVISIGYNGMPSGWENNCEEIVPEQVDIDARTITEAYERSKPEVMHAERNAIDKVAKHGGTGAIGAAMFTTHAPCLECAKSIYGCGITDLYYDNVYRHTDGIKFLLKCGVTVIEPKILKPYKSIT